MPRISAPTVAEHRAQQRQALISAARRVLVTEGAAGVTFGRVAAAAGLARSTVYEYFADRTALIVEVVAEEFPKWDQAAREAMAVAADPVERILAYAQVQLSLVAAGEHRIAAALRGVTLTENARRRFRELHVGLTEPLHDALVATGTDRIRWAVYVQGVIDAATTQLENGEDPATAIPAALAFLRAALR